MDDLTRLENLTDKQINILNGEIERNKKSTAVAYLLLIFLGGFGAHKFYLGKKVAGIVYLFLFLLGLFTLALGIGGLFLIIVGIACIVDLFITPKHIKEHEDKIKQELLARFERQNA